MSLEPIVVVEWRDARAYASSYGYSIKECLEFKLSVNETAGYLLKEDDDAVYLASERRDEGERFSDLTIIPTSQVISIRRLFLNSVKFYDEKSRN